MSQQKKVETFSAGCSLCTETVERVRRLAGPSCTVSVLDMRQESIARLAKAMGIRTLPAVVIDGTLAACCQGQGPNEATLRAAGLGQPPA